jgi:hypothetical protein
MANDYGDIPMIKLGKEVHVTKSGTELLCGETYQYGTINRQGKSINIIWRNEDAITCEKCKMLYSDSQQDVI